MTHRFDPEDQVGNKAQKITFLPLPNIPKPFLLYIYWIFQYKHSICAEVTGFLRNPSNTLNPPLSLQTGN